MKKILVVGQTPPPFGGQAIMIQRVLDGTYKNATLYHVRMSFSADMDDIGKFRLAKIFHAITIILKVTYFRVRHNIRVLYYPPAGPDYVPMLRDIAILLCVRWMFKKTIFHFHAAGISELYSQLPGYFKILFRWSYFKPDTAIQLSSFNPDDGAVLQATRKEIIPYGIDDEYLAMGFPRKSGHSVCNILFVGLVSESKGMLVLLDAIRILKEKGIVAKVAVVGKFVSADFRQVVFDKIETDNLQEYVEFKGVLTGSDKNEQYLNADIFCFPSFFESESFGLVVVEAMQFCLPVIATEWRGIQSLVKNGESGFLVPTHDSRAIAEKIVLLISAPELRARMGAKGREMYLQEYAIEKFYQRMDDCFANV